MPDEHPDSAFILQSISGQAVALPTWRALEFCRGSAAARHNPVKDNLWFSVIVPARNEAGNIGQILERTPEMGEAPK